MKWLEGSDCVFERILYYKRLHKGRQGTEVTLRPKVWDEKVRGCVHTTYSQKIWVV